MGRALAQEVSMNELMEGLVTKCGLSKEQGVKVVAYLEEHAHELPKLLGSTDIGKGLVEKLPVGVGSMVGGR
jgi:hypothetical protein